MGSRLMEHGKLKVLLGLFIGDSLGIHVINLQAFLSMTEIQRNIHGVDGEMEQATLANEFYL